MAYIYPSDLNHQRWLRRRRLRRQPYGIISHKYTRYCIKSIQLQLLYTSTQTIAYTRVTPCKNDVVIELDALHIDTYTQTRLQPFNFGYTFWAFFLPWFCFCVVIVVAAAAALQILLKWNVDNDDDVICLYWFLWLWNRFDGVAIPVAVPVPRSHCSYYFRCLGRYCCCTIVVVVGFVASASLQRTTPCICLRMVYARVGCIRH